MKLKRVDANTLMCSTNQIVQDITLVLWVITLRHQTNILNRLIMVDNCDQQYFNKKANIWFYMLFECYATTLTQCFWMFGAITIS